MECPGQYLLHRYRLHIFDLDDTLIATRATYLHEFERALTRFFPQAQAQSDEAHLQETVRAMVVQHGSSQSRKVIAGAAQLLCTSAPNKPAADYAIEQATRFYQYNFWNNLQAFAGVRSYVQQCTQRGSIVALVSNGIQSNQRLKLRLSGLYRFFTPQLLCVSGAFPPHCAKPAPFMLDLVLQLTGIPAADAIFYGNADIDLQAGIAAGVHTAYFDGAIAFANREYCLHSADYTFSDWRRLTAA